MPDQKRILVVDDEAQILKLLKDALASFGYRVDTAPDGETALQAVREHIYDAAILDFSLPDMDGLMIHREIRQIDEELGKNTLFVSGHAQSDHNLGYYSTYGVGFLSKPFNVEEVIDSLESLWNPEGPC